METEILYQDKLIEISNDSLTLNNYYFPSMKSKQILFKDIEIIEVYKPSLLRGKWRIQGTGDLRTWYPLDTLRPKRDKIFFIKYNNKWVRSAFTVVDSQKVEEIFRSKGLII